MSRHQNRRDKAYKHKHRNTETQEHVDSYHSVTNLLVLVGDLLGGGVVLLLLLLTASAKAQHQVEGRLLLDVVVRKGAAVLELLTSENQTLLIRGDSC